MGDRSTNIPGNQIEDDSITQSELDITNIPTDGQIIKINMPTGDMTAIDLPSGGSTDSVTKDINQTTHGLSVGNWVRHNGTNYVKAQADSDTNAESIGVVSSVTDVDNFTLTTEGYITGLSSLTPGEAHFLSASTAGAITATAPTGDAEVVKPILIADSTTSGYVVNMRGSVIGSNVADDLVLSGQTAEDFTIFDGTNWVAKGGTELKKVGQFTRDMTLATGTQAITGLGFKPSAVVFFVNQDGATGKMSMGFDDGTTVNCTLDAHNFVTDAWSHLTSVSISANTNASTGYNGKVNSFDSDGFTISWTKVNSPTGTLNIQFMAFR